MDFLDYYRDNLIYIRTLAAEFAAEFPKVAGRLSLSEFECQDPYIERLLEGTAFLSARVEKKLDDGYNNFLESVLNSVAPGALYPIPSGAVLELAPNYSNEQARKGFTLEAGTIFDALIPSINTPCRFSTFTAAPVVPFSVSGTEYVTRNIAGFAINNPEAASALHLKLSAEISESIPSLSELMFFIDLPEADASLLQRQLLHDTAGVYVKKGEGSFIACPDVRFDTPMYDGAQFFREKRLKGNVKGLSLLQNFFAYPSFFKFFSVKNIASVFSNTNAASLEILIVFRRREASHASLIDAASLKLNCAPAINLFTRRSDRIAIEKDAYEFHIVPERSATRDYEVASVNKLEFFNERNETLFYAVKFYDEPILEDKKERNFFSQRRRKTLFDRKVTQRSSYNGTEVFVAFTAQNQHIENAYQFTAELVCTNRDLPLLLLPDTALTSTAPQVRRAAFAVWPTRPNYPLIERGGGADFEKLSHIVFNMSAMLWQNGAFPLEMFKAMLRSYTVRSDDETERILDGIVSLESEPVTFRFFNKGAVFFEQGWKALLTLDETAYAGVGYYTFAQILREILFSLTPLNTILEIDFYTQQGGRIATWKTT
jgi:type VI secretion system VasI/ImpG family protein